MKTKKNILVNFALTVCCLLMVGYSQCGYAAFDISKDTEGSVTISVKNENVTEKMVRSIIEKAKVVMISVEMIDVNNKKLSTLFDGLNANKSAVKLVINGAINVEDIKALSGALQKNSLLTSCDLRSNNIGDKEALVIAKSLEGNTTLTNLWFVENNIGVVGAKAISNLLKGKSALTNLDFSLNQLGDAGVMVIAQALEGNRTLLNLELRGNGIGNKGAVAIANLIKKNSTLTGIGLCENSIGAVGAKALADSLKGNTSITFLPLGRNEIGNDNLAVLDSIDELLLRNEKKGALSKKSS